MITTAGNLPAKFVIHTVGPVWNGGSNDEERLLALSYFNSLELAVKHNIHSIAFPNISTGIYGFPKSKAAPIAINITKEFLASTEIIQRVIFICFDEENYSLYFDILGK